MKVLIAPDKFKGSLSAHEVASAIEEGLQSFENIEPVIQLMADGGEGSLLLIAQHYPEIMPITTVVSDPLFRPIQAEYLLSGETAFIEMSIASGMALLDQTELSCMNTTTFGTGQLILDAIARGAKEVNLFIGGSATNDLGIGMAAALGYSFLNTQGLEVLPIGKNMSLIRKIEKTDLTKKLEEIKFHVITDVDNSLYGHYGAAYMYGAQKGASQQDLLFLDNGLRSLSDIIHRNLHIDVSLIPGAGAAGGLGGGAMVFLDAKPISGTTFFMDLFDIGSLIDQVDVIITGEGSLDHQSLKGKVVFGIIEKCRSKNKPCIILCGKNDIGERDMPDVQVHDILSLATNLEDAMINAARYLREAAKAIELPLE